MGLATCPWMTSELYSRRVCRFVCCFCQNTFDFKHDKDIFDVVTFLTLSTTMSIDEDIFDSKHWSLHFRLSTLALNSFRTFLTPNIFYRSTNHCILHWMKTRHDILTPRLGSKQNISFDILTPKLGSTRNIPMNMWIGVQDVLLNLERSNGQYLWVTTLQSWAKEQICTVNTHQTFPSPNAAPHSFIRMIHSKYRQTT